MKDVIVILGTSTRQADRAALSLAIRRMGVRPRVLCTTDDAMRYAMAAGVDANWLMDEQDVAAPTYGLAIVGTCDDLAAAALAEARDAALLFDVLDAEYDKNDDLHVTRDMGRGAKDVLRIKGPAVLGMSDEAPSTLYVSRYRRNLVTRLPRRGRVIVESHEEPWQLTRPRTKTTDLALRTGGSATSRSLAIFGISSSGGSAESTGEHIIEDDPDICAQHLLRFLAHHGYIQAHVAGPTPRPAAPPVQAPRVEPVPVSEIIPPPAPLPPLRVASETVVSARIARGPRPVTGSVPGMQRRPIPMRIASDPAPASTPDASAESAGKLTRRPRPVDQPVSNRIRGPYPVRSQPHA